MNHVRPITENALQASPNAASGRFSRVKHSVLGVVGSIALGVAIFLAPTAHAQSQNTLSSAKKASLQASLQESLKETLSGTNARILLPGKERGAGMYSLAKSVRRHAWKSGEYETGAIYIKTRERFVLGKGSRSFQSSGIMGSLDGINVKAIKPVSAWHNSGTLAASDDFGVGRIYEVQFEAGMDVLRACEELSRNPEVEYAEPIPIHQLLQTDRVRPRDPLYSQQYQWRLIEAERAWAITRGDTNVVIAICDSGVDLFHEDLKDNIWFNPGETGMDAMGRDKRTNNIDDDANGKVDDFRGWDFGGNTTSIEANGGVYRTDNDPTPRPRRGLSSDGGAFDGVNHGVHVAGIAAATTDNDKGGAGSGFNCHILALKHSIDDANSPRSVFRGYEGILYAAQMRAKVVNCSWGGLSFYNQTLQDMINTATNMGTLVVAAAGNDASLMDDDYFPGSYGNVLSVGASDPSDLPAGFSNFGIKTTVFAPGDDIFSTFSQENYGVIGGTSMASPMTAGLAGLVLSIHPDWTPRQVAQQIRATSDNVLQPGAAERPFNYFGRINMFRALNTNRTLNAASGDLTPGIVLEDDAISADNGVITDMEPKRLVLSFKNILSNANNVSVTLVPLDPFAIALQPTQQLGALNTNQQKEVEFQVQLQSAALTATGIDVTEFVAVVRSGNYINYERISIPLRLRSGSALPGLVVSPVVNFPAAPVATLATVRITNTGNQGLTVSNATFTGANAGEFSLATELNNVPLGAGEFITRSIRFTPTTGATGSRTANFNVSALSDGKSSGGGTPIANGYTFSARAQAYQEITANNSPFTRLGAGIDDEEFDVPLGFSFQFGAKTYTTAKVVSNGFLAFGQQGSSILESDFVTFPISHPTYSAEGVVSAFGYDLFMTASGTITHETQGTAPNRVFIVQWKNASLIDNPPPAPDANFNFQIKLYETSNRIEFHYGQMSFTRGADFSSPTQVGLRGASTGDFNTRRVTTADNNNWTTSVLGTNVTDLCRLNSFTLTVPNGYLYTYTPGDFAALAAPRVTAFTRTAQLNATARTGGYLGTLPTLARGVDFGAVTVGTVRTLPVTLANYSPNPMTITELRVSPAANITENDFTIMDAPALPLVLPANSTRVLQVRYSPTTRDNLSSLTTTSPLLANVRIVHDGVQALLPLLGSGIAQNFVLRVVQDQGVDLTSGSGNFSRIDRLPPFPPAGSTMPNPPEVFVTTGTSRIVRQYSVRNFGTAPVTVTGGTFTVATNAAVTSNDFYFLTQFPFTVQPATQQTLTLVFAPKFPEEKMVDMRLFSSEAAESITRLGSRAAVPASIDVTPVLRALTPTIINSTPQQFRFPFGTVATNTSATRTIILRNSSTATMNISSIGFVGDNAGDFSVDAPLPTMIASGSTSAIVVRFRPVQAGFRTTQLTVAHNIAYGVDAVEVWGTGVAAKRLITPIQTLVLPSTEPLTTSNTINFTLSSTGRDTVRITSLRIVGKDSSQFRFARTIPDGTLIRNTGSSTATIFFAPDATLGVKEARVEVRSDAEFPVQFVDIRGTAAAPPASATIATLDVRAGIGQEIDVPVTLRNARRFTPGTQIYATLRVNASVLQPVGTTPQGQLIDGQRVIPLTLQVPASTGAGDTVLTRLRFRTLLGNDVGSPLRLDGVFSPNASLRAASGRLDLTDVPNATTTTPATRVELTGRAGDALSLPIVIRNRQNIPANAPMLVQLSYNASLLEFLNAGGIVTTSVAAGSRGITITVPRGAAADTTVTLNFRAGIGNAASTFISLSNFISLGFPESLVQNQAGARFTLQGLNQSGGQQLYFSSGRTLQLSTVSPNPANDAASVLYSLKDNSTVTLSLSNAAGTVVFEQTFREQSAGEHTARVPLTGLPSGAYLLTLRNTLDKESLTITVIR